MTFEDDINKYENTKYEDNIVILNGNIPVCLTSVHSMIQNHEDGSFKLNEPFTKAIVLYLNDKINTHGLLKTKDNGIDPNHTNDDSFKRELINHINENNIKLVLDIHGANESRDFDVELGTMQNLSADYSTINELKEALIHNGITNIKMNDPFKGGKVTQSLFFKTNVEVIQIEINANYRNNSENLNRLCNSLIYFINQYSEIQNKS